MENFFGHLKEEALRTVKNPSFQLAHQIIDDYVYFFNYERIQLKTNQTDTLSAKVSVWLTQGRAFCFVSCL